MSDSVIYSFHPEGRVIFVLTEGPSTPSDSPHGDDHDGDFGFAPACLGTGASQRSYIDLAELACKDDSKLSSTTALLLKNANRESEKSPSAAAQAPKRYLLQASEKHLVLSSPVFKQMLCGLWKETTDLATEGFVRFEIKNWNLQPFLILLQVMHGRPAPKGLDVDTITDVALLADYYQCLEDFRRCMRGWLREAKKTLRPSHETYTKCLWVSWILRSATNFKDFGSLVVYFAEGLIEGEGLPFHPVVLDKLNAARKKALTPIIRRLPMHYNNERPAEWVHRGFCGECATLLSGLLELDVRQATREAYPVAPFSGLSFAKLVVTECRGRRCHDMGIIHMERMYQTVDHSDAGSVSRFVRKLNIKPVTLEECLKKMAK